MKSVQKTASTRKTEDESVTDIPETTTSAISEDAADLLHEIDCCLADNEVDPDAQVKAQARREWDAMEKGEEGYPENDSQHYMWMAQYQHLFDFCCGMPEFDD